MTMATLIRYAAHLFFEDFYLKGELIVAGPVATWLGKHARAEVDILNCQVYPLLPDSKLSPFEQKRLRLNLNAVYLIGLSKGITTGSLVSLVKPAPFVLLVHHLLLRGLVQNVQQDGTLPVDSPFVTIMRPFVTPTISTRHPIPQNFSLAFIRRGAIRLYYPLPKSS